MTDFLVDLAEKRQKYLDGLDANEGDINLDIFEDFYPDRAHFLFELLQNAEDSNAKNVWMKLSEERVVFEHDGDILFTEEDVRRVTGINNSEKKNRPDKIGQFGLGFKSVFVYTATPIVESGDFAFQIIRLVKPVKLVSTLDDKSITRLTLPFNSPKKDAETSFQEIRSGIENLPLHALLFLDHIERIYFNVDDGPRCFLQRRTMDSGFVALEKSFDSQITTSQEFLVFKESVNGLVNRQIAVAFDIEKSNRASEDQVAGETAELKIIPAKNGRVAIYFPAEKETSNLRFHLHAPFVPELSRASIKDTDANKTLYEQLGGDKLAVELANESYTIYFTETHLTDIRAVISSDEQRID